MNNKHTKSYENRELRRKYYTVVLLLSVFMALLHTKLSDVRDTLHKKEHMLLSKIEQHDEKLSEIFKLLHKIETLLESKKDVEGTTPKENSKK